MRDFSDVLTVCFDSSLEDKSAFCVARRYGGKTIVLKTEVGEQADILYRILTDQTAKAEIKTDKEGENDGTDKV